MPTMLGIKDGSEKADQELTRQRRMWRLKERFTRTYLVLADTAADDENDILLAVGIPPLLYPLLGCHCVARHPKEIETVRHPVTGDVTVLWEVDCDFDNNIDPGEDTAPESRPPKTRWTGETEEELLERDIVNGAALQTANYERILITTPVVVPVLEITRWEFYPFTPSIMLYFANRVNSTWFWGAPPGTALMLPMDVGEYELINVDGTAKKYVPVTYRIKFKLRPDPAKPATLLANPWKARVLHQGYAYRKTAGSPPEIHVDANKRPSPVNLNLDGTENTSAIPVFLEFNRFATANFNALSLGPF